MMETEELRPLLTQYSTNESFGWWMSFFPGVSPLSLHMIAFQGTLKVLMSDAQKAHYMPQADNYNIIGCYAQTELGHGSNVAAMETTATYNTETKEFTIHSPTIKAAKFWPGSMGQFSNYAVVMARCIAQGNDYGV